MMELGEALEVLAATRGEYVVISTMSSVGAWAKFSDTPRDFAYLPSSMGQAVPLGLGLALAQPGLGVIVLSGDGGLLMNLGCLVTLACHSVPVYVLLLNNGLYEVTGGQTVAGASRTNYAGIASASGIDRVYSFTSKADWELNAADCLGGLGPVFVELQIRGKFGESTPAAPRSMAEQIARLQSTW